MNRASLHSATGLLADARWKGYHGIGRFAREVLGRLPRHSELVRGPKPLSIGDPLWLSYQVTARRPSVFFSPGFNPPLLCRAPFVFTIHDLMQIQSPNVATPAKRLYYRLVVKPACHRAYRVLTVSDYSRAEILSWSGLAENRVVNVGNGVASPFRSEGPCYEPGFPYVLYVGNCRPHKNLPRLLLAFSALDQPDLRLVLVGNPTSLMTASVLQTGLTGRTEWVSDVSDHQLAAMYRGAELLVLPSLIEGFGLAALEAMACGTPVVLSKTTALPEVAGPAGFYFDPLDVGDMRQALARVLRDRNLRRVMRALGLERARQFSWDKVAARVKAVLEQAAG